MQISRFVQTSRLNSAESAVVKSTYPDHETPKIKHVENLIDIIKSEMCSSGFVHQKKDEDWDVIRLLSKRIRSGNKNWQIVLKTLCVTNTLLREADIEFTKQLTSRPFLKAGQSFWDPAEPHISRFVQSFAKYLQEKLQSFVDLDFSIERKIGEGTTFLKQYDYKQLGWILPRVATQMEFLSECQFVCNSSIGLHPIISGVLRELVKDGLRLYSAFTLSVFLILEQFQKLTLSQQKWTVKMGHRYFKINSMFEKWCRELVRWHIIESQFLPKSWDSIPKSLVTALEEYIHEAENSSQESSSESMSKKKHSKHEVHKLSELLGATALNFDPDEDNGFNFLDDFKDGQQEQILFDPQPAEIKGNLFDPISHNDNYSLRPTQKKPQKKPKPEAFDPLSIGFEEQKVSKPSVGLIDLLFDTGQGKGFSFDAPVSTISNNVIDSRPLPVSSSLNFSSSKPERDPFAQPQGNLLFDLPAREPVSLFDPPSDKTGSFFDPLAPASVTLFTTKAPAAARPDETELLFFDPEPEGDKVSASLFESDDFSFGQKSKKGVSVKSH